MMIYPKQHQDTAAVAAHYNDLDRFYRDVWGDHVHHGLWTNANESPEAAVKQLVRFVAREAGIEPGDRVCDVGCGYGGTARLLVDEYDAKVTGLTVSDAQFEYAVAQTPEQEYPQFLLRNWEQNELPADSFDALVSIECLAHVNDKQRYFDEIHRVLRPGRSAAIAAWLSAEKPTSWQVHHLLEPICREGRLPSMGSVSEYEALIERAGLTAEKYTPLTSRVRKTWIICARRVALGIVTRSDYRRYLMERPTPNWIFFVTLGRILVALYRNIMQYGVFVLRKPEASGR